MRSKFRNAMFLTTAMTIFAAAPAIAQSAGGEMHATDRQSEHVVHLPDQIKFQQAPPGLPPGTEIVVLHGDPGATGGHFVARLKAPPNWYVAPHSHSMDENLTIISGTLLYGMGDIADKAVAQRLPPGSYVFVPGKHTHYVWAGDEELVLEIQSAGPFDINYVNAADDPRSGQISTVPQ